jgi:hypothetical protein
MAVLILALAIVTLLLIVIGGSLFLGEWLFGSMAWGILHGTLFFIACIVPLGLDLAGGRRDAWLRGLIGGIVLTLFLWAVFASNILRDSAVNAARSVETTLAIEPALLPTLVGLAAGTIVLGVLALIVGIRWGSTVALVLGGIVVGAIVGAILGSVTFDTKGALAVAVTVGLIAWIGFTAGLAASRGFDPEGRYAPLVPRETMAMAEETKAFLQRQLRRQRGKVLGR